MSKNKIALLGGTFDPVHIGHLHIACEILEHFRLNKVLFCPAFTSPFKMNDENVASPSHRLEMTKLAIEGYDQFSVLDYEINQASVSYTIDTLEYLKKERPDDEYYLILGEDVLKTFFDWKRPEDILKLASILTASRDGVLKKNETKIPKEYLEEIEKGFCKIHKFELSSTYIRERIQKKLNVSHLLPPKVLDYIHKHQLYSLPK